MGTTQKKTMKTVKSCITLSALLLSLLLLFCSCDYSFGTGGEGGVSDTGKLPDSISIVGSESLIIFPDDTVQLTTDVSDVFSAGIAWSVSDDCVSITSTGLLRAEEVGEATVTARLGEHSDTVSVRVLGGDGDSDPIVIDPYKNLTSAEFYRDYEPATSYMDSYYRTLHGFMSGTIDEQDQEPTLSPYRPMLDGLFVKNSVMNYSSDGNAYYIYDAYGNIVNVIYRGGAYITLEEVAAYVLAFGDVPANYVSGKSTKPTSSVWGEYLRLNHTKFSGNTTKYPYEPALPSISGIGGILQYYEIDMGTTGTDCDPSYAADIYNDGRYITRGAARIVYARFYVSGGKINDISQRYVFYTYNHYNDFQEYLNYEGGWGEMFGNITGGGTISSKYDYNPTPYVAVTLSDIRNIFFGSESAYIERKGYLTVVTVTYGEDTAA